MWTQINYIYHIFNLHLLPIPAFGALMDLSIKNHILSKNLITKFSLNQQHNILATLIEGNQYTTFYQISLHPRHPQK